MIRRGPSMAPPGTGAGGGSLAHRLAEKKQELQYYQQLQQDSALVAQELEALKAKLETIADGTEAVAAVMTNWQSVLRAVSLASSSLSKYRSEDFEQISDVTPLPETLVRIRLNNDE